MINSMSSVYEYSCIQAQALNAAPPELVAEMSIDIIDSLVTITGQVEDTSVLPLDLGTTVDILNSVIRYNHIVIGYFILRFSSV